MESKIAGIGEVFRSVQLCGRLIDRTLRQPCGKRTQRARGREKAFTHSGTRFTVHSAWSMERSHPIAANVAIVIGGFLRVSKKSGKRKKQNVKSAVKYRSASGFISFCSLFFQP
ncbi:MAG: hypothetical protein WDN46_07215 [Methylocella sp.]